MLVGHVLNTTVSGDCLVGELARDGGSKRAPSLGRLNQPILPHNMPTLNERRDGPANGRPREFELPGQVSYCGSLSRYGQQNRLLDSAAWQPHTDMVTKR